MAKAANVGVGWSSTTAVVVSLAVSPDRGSLEEAAPDPPRMLMLRGVEVSPGEKTIFEELWSALLERFLS